MEIGLLVEGTIEMVGSEATETVLGRVVQVEGSLVTVEGMITSRREMPGAMPTEVEIQTTMRLPEGAIEVLG